MPYRILILEGVRDELAARREVYVQRAPSLAQHQFDHLYATQPPALDETMPMHTRLARSQAKKLDENALLALLDQRLSAFQPDILLVYSGALFQSCPDEIMYVMQTLKRLHPGLRIGFRPRPFEQYGPKAFLEYTAEMRDLMAGIFADYKR